MWVWPNLLTTPIKVERPTPFLFTIRTSWDGSLTFEFIAVKMRGGKSPKVAQKAGKKAQAVAAGGQAGRGNGGGKSKSSNGGNTVSPGKKRKKKDKQLPTTSSQPSDEKGSNATAKRPEKEATTPKATRVGSGMRLSI